VNVVAEPRLDFELPVRPLSPPSVPPAADAPAQRSWTAREPTAAVSMSKAAVPEREDVGDAPRPAESGEWMKRIGTGLRPVGVVTAAALAAFLGMNQVAKWLAPEPEVAAAPAPAITASPSAAVAIGPDEADDLVAAPPGDERVAQKTVANVRDLALPEGLTVPAGKGLLEVDSGGQHKLYVDNVFVGRGPVRRIPLDPGTHQVQTQLDGVEELHSVAVVANRRARLELTESGQ
jgi:hypothetical protein